jgi:hypothetical protein
LPEAKGKAGSWQWHADCTLSRILQRIAAGSTAAAANMAEELSMKAPAIVLGIVVSSLLVCCKQSSDDSETSEMVDIVRPVGNRSFTIMDGRDRLRVRRLGQDENVYYAAVEGDRSRFRPSWAWDASRNGQADVEVAESQFGGEHKGPIWRALGPQAWPIGNHVRGSVHLATAEQLAGVNWRYTAELDWGYRIDAVERWCRDNGDFNGVATVISFFAYCGGGDDVSLSDQKRCLADRSRDGAEMERCPAMGELHWTAFEGGHGQSVISKHAVEPLTAVRMTCREARQLGTGWQRAPRLALSIRKEEFRECGADLRLGFLFGIKGSGARADIQFGSIEVMRTNDP